VAAPEEILRSAYRAFNERDVDAALRLMAPDVDWPNAWEGGRVRGREAVGGYWRRQFEQISSRVEPVGFAGGEDGTIAVTVHQVVEDARTGEPVSDSSVVHRYWLEDGLITRMEVEAPPGNGD
jgi:ketosteroid isomerase-like protein